MCDLINYLIRVWNDSVKLFESLEGLIVVAETLVNETQVIDGLNAVSLDTDSLQEEFLGAIVILVNEEAVTFIDEGLRIVSIVLDGKV